MCEPVSIATISTVASIAGTAVSAYSAFSQGQSAKAQAKYQQQVANNNKIYLDRQAERTRQEGEIASQEARRKARQLIARQKTVFAGSGVDIGTGTPVDVFGDTAAFGEIDAMTIRDRYESQAVSYEQQGLNQGAQGALYGAAGQNAYRSGIIGAGSTILSGAGNVANKWYRFKQDGIID